MAVVNIDLPVINVSSDIMLDPARRKLEGRKLVDSFTDLGFCFLSGIEGYQKEELFHWTKWFFNDVPEEVKFDQLATKHFNPKNPNLFRGYFPLIPNKMSSIQIYDLGPLFSRDERDMEEGNPFTEDTPRLVLAEMEKVEQFYEVMYRHHSLLHRTAELLMSLIAEAGNEKSDYFSSLIRTCPQIRPCKYPKRVDEIPEKAYLPDGRVLCNPPHVDSGLLTLLQTFGFSGLEILLGNDWFSVPKTKSDCLVVNVGEQLTAMSAGRFKSTIHRVVNIAEGDRYSMPFFHYPHYDANINLRVPRDLLPILDKEEKKEDDYYPFAAFQLKKIPIYARFSGLVESLPEWMRIKYVEGYEGKKLWAEEAGVDTDEPIKKVH